MNLLETTKNVLTETSNHSVTFDFTGTPSSIRAKAEKAGLKFDMVNSKGPGGGWPEGKVSGPREKVKKFLLDVVYANEQDAADAHPELFSDR